ncbi:MAG: PD40 domain-containing protein [candidate division Zixibacteria bacterium]|nr:PD40 domain-containing protein [candidate division Zixibacteria bacterium]
MLAGGELSWGRTVSEIYGRVVKVGGEFEPFRVGVDQFRLKNPDQATDDDRKLAQAASDIVFADLDFSYLFESVRPDSVYLRIMGLSKIDHRGWHHLGADYLVEGEISFDADNVTLTYTLSDVATEKEFFTRVLKSRRESVRLLAHALADEVYRELARADGIFQSRLAYLHENGGHKEVHVCDFDGADDSRMTGDNSIALSPRWAGPNAVSYTSYRDGNPDVWLFDLLKDRATKFSSLPGLNSGCSWTKDGRLYALSMSVEGNPEIYVGERASHRPPERITFSPGIDTSPAFSPDGKRIVFTSDRGGTPQVYIMDVDGANLERLSSEGEYNDSPDWSPTLDLIVFVSRGYGVFQICTIRPDGSGLRQLTEVASNENPHWSPDGLHVVFASNRTGGYEIYTMSFDGSGVRRVTTTAGNSNPSWSP